MTSDGEWLVNAICVGCFMGIAVLLVLDWLSRWVR